jgi:endo-1,4-beta-xylanase
MNESMNSPRQNRLAGFAVLAAFTVCGLACTSHGQLTLKQAFEKDFLIGAALNDKEVTGQDSSGAALAVAQFSSITPENALKWEPVHPKPDQYNFEPADRFTDFGVKNGMFPVGHVLVWHSQTPKWVFEGPPGKPANRETLLGRMRDHILTVVGRYKGRIRGWDVVNEALEDDGTLRKSPWLTIIGEDYIQKAFEFAAEADSSAELYYNDYNLWKPEKAAAAVRLVKDLKARGVRVDGIGEQAHWALDYPTLKEAEAAVASFEASGINVFITELDISVCPNPWNYTGAEISRNFELQKKLNPYPETLPDSVQKSLAARYAEFFALFRRHAGTVKRVTLWGVHDGQSWLNYWPVRGRTDYPLLFDRQCKPKPAFNAVIQAAETN